MLALMIETPHSAQAALLAWDPDAPLGETDDAPIPFGLAFHLSRLRQEKAQLGQLPTSPPMLDALGAVFSTAEFQSFSRLHMGHAFAEIACSPSFECVQVSLLGAPDQPATPAPLLRHWAQSRLGAFILLERAADFLSLRSQPARLESMLRARLDALALDGHTSSARPQRPSRL